MGSNTMNRFLIYGANGYTGTLITREAVARGMNPALAGRNTAAVDALARELQLEARPFSLDDPVKTDAALVGMQAVLHCAGPFIRTSQAMADACLRNRVHYLDITGEADVFQALADRDAEAKAANVMLLPGVGFDVVPSDCLAAHLKRRLPSATHLALAFQSLTRLSRGTATTMTENLHRGGVVRINGTLKQVPAAWKTRAIDFGRGPVQSMTIPWGDVVTAWYSTGIPNIEVYMSAPWKLRTAARISRAFGWLLRTQMVQNYFKKKIQAGPPGPSDEQRARGRCILWGEATDAAGNKAVSRLEGPEAYTMTVRTALAVAERVLAGQATPGFQTPATMFGPDFVLGVEGVSRVDVKLD